MNDLDPTQSEAVRRALAAARHDGPIPAEVAARLDATLADLVAGQSAPVDPVDAVAAAAMVAPEGARVLPFWRRRVPVILAAAATVVAAAVVAPQLINDSSLHSATSAGDSARSDNGDESYVAESPSSDNLLDSPAYEQPMKRALGAAGVTLLHDATLTRELSGLVQDDASNGASKVDRNQLDSKSVAPYAASAVMRCGPVELPEGARIFRARYHHHRAIVVALPVVEGSTRVAVYDCRTDPRVPARTLTVPLAD